MMVLEEQLFQYGIAGVFIAYLIYRDMTINKEFIATLKGLNDNVMQFKEIIQDWRKG